MNRTIRVDTSALQKNLVRGVHKRLLLRPESANIGHRFEAASLFADLETVGDEDVDGEDLQLDDQRALAGRLPQ